jgi:hypothetical protein
MKTQYVRLGTGRDFWRRPHEKQSGEYLASIRPCALGVANPCARLTDEVALAIYNAPGKHLAIAAEFGIGRQHVSKIKQRKAWTHIHDKVETWEF